MPDRLSRGFWYAMSDTTEENSNGNVAAFIYSNPTTDLQEKGMARLRESRILAPSGRRGEFTQPNVCLNLQSCIPKLVRSALPLLNFTFLFYTRIVHV